jgi:16S rRNA (cytidine1402-2'-O)-methyltransferase
VNPGSLYIVATPIGNLEDISPRARQLLAIVDVVAAEDTRHTGKLLKHFGINTPLFALHEHNERDATVVLLRRLAEGASVALVSDAGTPLVSDPGFRLVREAHRNGIRVSPVPGPSAVVAALSVAGLPTDRYCFEGFLPAKGGARRERLAGLQEEARSMVFYVAVHRIAAVLEDLVASFGEAREAFLGRELTKLHEQCVAATLGELLGCVQTGRIAAKGEFVIVVAGNPDREAGRPGRGLQVSADRLLAALVAVLPGRQAAAIVADVCGLARNDVYRRMLQLSVEGTGEGD